MRILKFIFALSMLLAALALLRFAVVWRAPFLPELRPMLLVGTVALSLLLVGVQLWLCRISRGDRPALWWISAAGLVAASLALATTFCIEFRFQLARHQVLNGDPDQLQRVGRHLMVGYLSLNELRSLVKLKAVAGVFVSSRNVRGKSISQVRKEIDELQSIRAQQGLPPLWIATDQEGGIVSRLSPPLSSLPALSDIIQRYGDTGRREQAVREFGLKQGSELARIGINLNFAPVVDVNHRVMNPNDRYTRIFKRAISDDPRVVAQVAAWYCDTLAENGVACTLKHFPGLGRVFEDTHFDPAALSTPLDELNKTDWLPFRALMQGDGMFVMLGHARLNAVDNVNPASMSSRVVGGLLRGTWKYDGVLITDNFSMMAVYRSPKGMEDGAVQALNAGVDLILISYDPAQYYRVMEALLSADEKGTLDREALQESDARLQRAMTRVCGLQRAHTRRGSSGFGNPIAGDATLRDRNLHKAREGCLRVPPISFRGRTKIARAHTRARNESWTARREKHGSQSVEARSGVRLQLYRVPRDEQIDRRGPRQTAA